MYPEKNPTKNILETLDHELCRTITDAMYMVLDNGDRPDKRIEAIINLNQLQTTMLHKLEKLIDRIPDAP
jgi:hypothetical protein